MGTRERKPWWADPEQAYWAVALTAAILFAVCTVAFWRMTADWDRALSYGVGFTAVWAVLAAVGVHRRTMASSDEVEPPTDDDWKPPLFGNG